MCQTPTWVSEPFLKHWVLPALSLLFGDQVTVVGWPLKRVLRLRGTKLSRIPRWPLDLNRTSWDGTQDQYSSRSLLSVQNGHFLEISKGVFPFLFLSDGCRPSILPSRSHNLFPQELYIKGRGWRSTFPALDHHWKCEHALTIEFGDNVITFLFMASQRGTGAPDNSQETLKKRITVIGVIMSWGPSLCFWHPSLFAEGACWDPPALFSHLQTFWRLAVDDEYSLLLQTRCWQMPTMGVLGHKRLQVYWWV